MSSRAPTSSKKKQLLNTVTVNLGCGGSCRRPNLSSVFTPKPKQKPTKLPSYHNNHIFNNQYSSPYSSNPFSSSSDYYNHSTSSSSSTINNNNHSSPLLVDGFGRRTGKKTMAVEKDSVDPYVDFRASMLQMIVENEIYTRERLRELLNCFLQLNSQSLHGVIIRAFTEIWNSLFSSSSEEVGNDYYYKWRNDYSCDNNYSYNYSNGRFRSGYYASPTVYVRSKSYEI